MEFKKFVDTPPVEINGKVIDIEEINIKGQKVSYVKFLAQDAEGNNVFISFDKGNLELEKEAIVTVKGNFVTRKAKDKDGKVITNADGQPLLNHRLYKVELV